MTYMKWRAFVRSPLDNATSFFTTPFTPFTKGDLVAAMLRYAIKKGFE